MLNPASRATALGCSACERGEQWQRALIMLLCELRRGLLETGVTSYSTGISPRAARLPNSGSGFQRFSASCGGRKLDPSVMTHSAGVQRLRDRRAVAAGSGAAQRAAGGRRWSPASTATALGSAPPAQASSGLLRELRRGEKVGTQHHQLQCHDQRLRDGRALAAGWGAAYRAAARTCKIRESSATALGSAPAKQATNGNISGSGLRRCSASCGGFMLDTSVISYNAGVQRRRNRRAVAAGSGAAQRASACTILSPAS